MMTDDIDIRNLVNNSDLLEVSKSSVLV